MFGADSKSYISDIITKNRLSESEELARKIHSYYYDFNDGVKYNFKVNVYDDHIEMIKYKSEFRVPLVLNKDDREMLTSDDGLILPEKLPSDINRDRLFRLEDKDLVLNKPNITNFEALRRSRLNLIRSRLRTLNSLYSYSLSNNWNYWVTLTFDRSKYDSTDSQCVSYHYNLFSKKVKELDPKAHMLFIMEYHHDKEHIHLHGFIHSSINCLDFSLVQAFDPNTNKELKDFNGNNIYNTSLWSLGYNTVVKIPFNANKYRIANYLTKYIGKDIEMPYGTKMLLHTRGLKSRYEYLANISDNELQSIINEYYFEIGHPEYLSQKVHDLPIFKKETDRFIVFNLYYNSDPPV